MAKHPGGRPTKYKPEYCQAIIEYFKDPEVQPLPLFEDYAIKCFQVNPLQMGGRPQRVFGLIKKMQGDPRSQMGQWGAPKQV